ncbi:hypothetical protein VIGAN_10247900, partial [Vigna angularis var. angularis]
VDRCDTRLFLLPLPSREGNVLFLQQIYVCISLHSSFLSLNKEIKTEQSWWCLRVVFSTMYMRGSGPQYILNVDRSMVADNSLRMHPICSGGTFISGDQSVNDCGSCQIISL